MSDTFIILRRESVGEYSTRGPLARGMSLADARAEVVRLKNTYPHQDFVIMGEVGEVTRSERVKVKILPPDLAPAHRKEPRARKSRREEPPAEPEVAQEQNSDLSNVVALRKEGCA